MSTLFDRLHEKRYEVATRKETPSHLNPGHPGWDHDTVDAVDHKATTRNKRKWQATPEYTRAREAGQASNERREAKKAAKAKAMGVERKPKYRSMGLPPATQKEIQQAKNEDVSLFDRISR